MLPSTRIVIDVLGGGQKVATMLGTTAKVVSGWRTTDRFPAATYVTLQGRLKKMGLSAPDSLWPMKGAKPKRRRAQR
jgi:hypothetical protein